MNGRVEYAAGERGENVFPAHWFRRANPIVPSTEVELTAWIRRHVRLDSEARVGIEARRRWLELKARGPF